MVVHVHSPQSQHLGMEGRSIKSLMPGLGWGRYEERKLFIRFRNKIHWNLWLTRHPTILSLLLKNQNRMLANSVSSTVVTEGVSGLYSRSSQSRSREPRANLGTTGTIPDQSFIFVFSAGQGAGDSPPDEDSVSGSESQDTVTKTAQNKRKVPPKGGGHTHQKMEDTEQVNTFRSH